MHCLIISCALIPLIFFCLSFFGWNQHLKSDDDEQDALFGI